LKILTVAIAMLAFFALSSGRIIQFYLHNLFSHRYLAFKKSAADKSHSSVFHPPTLLFPELIRLNIIYSSNLCYFKWYFKFSRKKYYL